MRKPPFFSVHPWFSLVLAFVATACGSAPPPKPAAVEEAPIDLGPVSSSSTAGTAAASSSRVPHELVGAALQASQSSFKISHDQHAPDSVVPGRNISWFVPKKIQNIEDATPLSTHLGFASNKLTAVVFFFKGQTACKGVGASLESHYGTPAEKADTKTLKSMTWSDDSASLSYLGTSYSAKHPEDDSCRLVLEDTSSVKVAQESDPGPPMGHSVDHFGTAKLLARKSSFTGLTFKEKGDDDTEWDTPASKSYHGIALGRFTYQFQHDVLANVGFEAAKFADCPKLLSLLKAEYGKADEQSNPSNGTSYDWASPGGKLTFNMFTDQHACGGILYAIDPANTTGSPFFTGGGSSTSPASSTDPFETSSPTTTRIVR